MEVLLFAAGLLIGFYLSKTLAGKYEGDKSERSLRFSMGEYMVHVHHWLYFMALSALLWYADIRYPIIFGLLSGAIIQGLLYKDRFVFIYRKRRS
jgi:hypothetical protein